MTYTFTNSRLVDLDGLDAGLLEVADFVAEGEGELTGLDLLGDIRTRERPVEDGHRASQHTLHGPLGEALSIAAPPDGHRARTADIGDDDGRADVTKSRSMRLEQTIREKDHIPRSVALNPGVLSEDETVKLFTEVLNHVIALRLSVDEKVKPDFLLETNDFLNLLLDELLILFLSELALAKLETRRTDLLGLLKGKIRKEVD